MESLPPYVGNRGFEAESVGLALMADHSEKGQDLVPISLASDLPETPLPTGQLDTRRLLSSAAPHGGGYTTCLR